MLEALGYGDVRYAVFISVDAEREPSFALDRSADIPDPIQSLTAIKNILATSSFDASMHVGEALQQWEDELRASRKPGTPPPEFFMINLSLRTIADDGTRRRFMAIPTSLRLPADSATRCARSPERCCANRRIFRS